MNNKRRSMRPTKPPGPARHSLPPGQDTWSHVLPSSSIPPSVPPLPLPPRVPGGVAIGRMRGRQKPDPRAEPDERTETSETEILRQRIALETQTNREKDQARAKMVQLMSELVIGVSPVKSERAVRPDSGRERLRQAAEALARTHERLIHVFVYDEDADAIAKAIQTLMEDPRFLADLKLLSTYFRP